MAELRYDNYLICQMNLGLKYFFDFRDEKNPRDQAGNTGDANRTSTLMVCGVNITEEVLRRRLAPYEPFTIQFGPEEEKYVL